MADEASVVGDLLGRERRERLADAPALSQPATGRRYDYRRLCTAAWRAGNYLRGRGAGAGRPVRIADDPAPEALLCFLGAALVGAPVRFGPPGEDYRVAVAPAAGTDATGGVGPAAPGRSRVAYGGDHEDPAVARFERDVHGENPTEPPERVAPDDTALLVGGADAGSRERDASGSVGHADLLDAGRAVARRWSLARGDAVALRASLIRPGTVVAGVVAPLVAGAAVRLPASAAASSTAAPDDGGDYAVVADAASAPEDETTSPGTAFPPP